MNNERDTKFLGFAKLLWPEIATKLAQLDFEHATRQDARTMDYKIEQILAQRAYDLVYYALDNIWEVHNPEVLLDKIPDLTQWPKTEQ